MNTIPLNAFGTLQGLLGETASGQAAQLSSFTATIDNPAAAYLVPASQTEVDIYPKQAALPNDGGTTVVTITLNGRSQNGTAVAPTQIEVALTNNPAPPQATQIVQTKGFTTAFTPSPAPPDPGVPTVTLI